MVETYAFADRPTIWHFDLYRLEAPDEVFELGIEDALGAGISLIEWPERIAALLPAERLDLALAAGAHRDARVATLTASPRWRERVAAIAHG